MPESTAVKSPFSANSVALDSLRTGIWVTICGATLEKGHSFAIFAMSHSCVPARLKSISGDILESDPLIVTVARSRSLNLEIWKRTRKPAKVWKKDRWRQLKKWVLWLQWQMWVRRTSQTSIRQTRWVKSWLKKRCPVNKINSKGLWWQIQVIRNPKLPCLNCLNYRIKSPISFN